MPSIICWQTPCRTLSGQVRSEQELTKSFTVYGSVEIDMWQLLVFYGGFITMSVWAFGLDPLIPASCWAELSLFYISCLNWELSSNWIKMWIYDMMGGFWDKIYHFMFMYLICQCCVCCKACWDTMHYFLSLFMLIYQHRWGHSWSLLCL